MSVNVLDKRSLAKVFPLARSILITILYGLESSGCMRKSTCEVPGYQTFHFLFQEWSEKAKSESDPKKRKREHGGEEDEEMESDESVGKKKKPSDSSAKLSAFAFNKE